MRIYLAPMEGITTYLFRNAFDKFYGGIDCYYTPFIANRHMIQKERYEADPAHNEGLRVVPQVLTNDIDAFVSLSEQFAALGYDEVNLNLGCPSGTVVSKRKGSGMLYDPEKLDDFFTLAFKRSPLPISVKTRIGIRELSEWDEILSVYKKHPIKELIIHPRLQKQFYREMPDLASYVKATKALDIPLCYNGDIYDADSMKRILEAAPDTQAVMLGRGLLRNPELPMILLGKKDADAPRNMDRFLAFHEEIVSEYKQIMAGEVQLLHRMKELLNYLVYYISNHPEDDIKKIRKAKSLPEYMSAVRIVARNQ